MKNIILLFLFFSSSSVIAQVPFKITTLTKSQIPASVQYKGRLQQAFSWRDKLGDNILILSSSGPSKAINKDFPGETAATMELVALHFLKKEKAYALLWKVTDAEQACAFDVTAEFIKAATRITDLDNDGIAETTVQYKLACRSDVSPAYMKLIMHEGEVKYSLRGYMWIETTEGHFNITGKNANLEKLPKKDDEWAQIIQTYGRYESEKEFKNAPSSFLTFARRQWLKFAIEKFE